MLYYRTKYYSNTSFYYNVLLYYKVLLQYFSVVQGNGPDGPSASGLLLSPFHLHWIKAHRCLLCQHRLVPFILPPLSLSDKFIHHRITRLLFNIKLNGRSESFFSGVELAKLHGMSAEPRRTCHLLHLDPSHTR